MFPISGIAKAPAKKGAEALPEVGFPSGAELRGSFESLSKAAVDNRTAGSEGGRRAFDWIQKRARAIPGWVVSEEPFSPDVAFAEAGYTEDFAPYAGLDPKTPGYVKNKRAVDQLKGFAQSLKGKTLSNLVLRKEGSDSSWALKPLILIAHFDTIAWRRTPFEVLASARTQGADDNGAAVVALLAVAESLKSLKPKRPLELVFTDAAEAYFLGARAHAERLRASDAKADVVVLEMIGWDSPKKNHANAYMRSEGQPGWERDQELATVFGQGVAAQGIAISIVRNNTDRAEHHAFHKSFQAAILLGVDWEYGFDDAHYHSTRDSVEIVDWDFAAHMGKGVAVALVRMGTGK